MVQKLGFIVENLGHSQLSFELSESINKYYGQNNQTILTLPDITVFTESISPNIHNPKAAVMELYDTWGYDGTIIATTLSTAKTLLQSHGINDKIFYIYNFEWIFNPYLFYDYLECLQKLKVITRTVEHAQLIKNLFNKKSLFTLPVLDVEELWTKLNTKNS